MAVGLSDKLWLVEDIVKNLVEDAAPKPGKRGRAEAGDAA
jgi:hypothetical protein